jgi:hypothetical protein
MMEESWFVFIIWLVIFLASWKLNKTIIYVAGGMIGIFLGFLVMTDVYAWLGIILLILNLYVIFHGLFQVVNEK